MGFFPRISFYVEFLFHALYCIPYFIQLFLKKILLFYYSYVHTMLGSFLPPAPTPSLTTHSAPSLSPPTPSITGRNYFALISNSVEERVYAIIGRNKGFCWLR
jgi:hypothetical protein